MLSVEIHIYANLKHIKLRSEVWWVDGSILMLNLSSDEYNGSILFCQNKINEGLAMGRQRGISLKINSLVEK